jgi:hypothetical protein
MNAGYVSVYSANGQLHAEMVKLLLESAGIRVLLAGESVGRSYGLNMGTMGEVEVFVPGEQAQEARELLAAMERGDLETPDSPEDLGNSEN